jgi:hypothetical protein
MIPHFKLASYLEEGLAIISYVLIAAGILSKPDWFLKNPLKQFAFHQLKLLLYRFREVVSIILYGYSW